MVDVISCRKLTRIRDNVHDPLSEAASGVPELTTFTHRRERVRELLAGDRLVYTAQVWGPVPAIIAEDLEYELGFIAGPMSSHVLLGAPNHYLRLLTATELADHVRRIARASALPLLTVVEDGFGNAMNVMRTVEEFEIAGSSVIILDDPVLPFPFGEEPATIGSETWEHPWEQMATIDEQVGKLKAALTARRDSSLVICARTRALSIGRSRGPTGLLVGTDESLQDVVERVQAYERAGADAIMVGDIHSRAELEAVHGATNLPLIVNSASSDRLVAEGKTDDAALLANGVRIRNSGNQAYWASVIATFDALSAMRSVHDGQVPASVPRISKELKARVRRLDRYAEWSKAFMS
jgi:oxaloacetate decarboxylase